MKKDLIAISEMEIVNYADVASGKTNLLLVPVDYFNDMGKSIKIGESEYDVTWRQYGYLSSVPNGYAVFKIKRGLPSSNSEKTVEFGLNEGFGPYSIVHVIEKKSVVLSTHYFQGEDIPFEHQTSVETIEKLKSIQPGDTIVIADDGQTITANVLSLLREDTCGEVMVTKKVGRIPYDYASVVFELTDVTISK